MDHLAIVAPSLESGAALVERVLGVSLQTGGEHLRMGTHNLLLSLGESLYLEVIAPNPRAASPERPRWFNLDALRKDTPPHLATWVVRTPDIRQSLQKASEPLGAEEPMSRGDLNWRISIPEDGSLPLAGVAPTLIQWEAGAMHPAAKLQPSGISLEALRLYTPEPERLLRLLESLSFEGPVSVQPLSPGESPRLEARMMTPRGIRVLSA
jgi:hypothetical protein